VPAVHRETIVDYARRSRDVSENDVVSFLLVDGARLSHPQNK